ncbi:MAG: domain S-box/diguanylate cyclase protein [Burkholderiaceae bacterium]|nr:domain S-box/diguanylate cyclase protein [Burkholderiaceae bacterium]
MMWRQAMPAGEGEMLLQRKKIQTENFRWRLIIATALLNLLAYGLVAWTLHQSRQHYHERAEMASQNIAKLLEQNIADTIEKIEMNLHAVVDEVARQRAAGRVDNAALTAFLKRLHSRSSGMSSMRLVNAAGIITHGTGKTLVTEADVTDRTYFQFLRNHADAGTYVSGPVQGRTSGEWILIFSRRIANSDGSFDGVVNGTIELSQLKWLFSAVNVGERGSISLRNEALGVIARYPEIAVGANPSSLRSQLPELVQFAREGRHSGTFIATSSIDGVERVISVRKIGSFPLYLVVGLAPKDYFVRWWHSVAYSVVALVLFSVVTIYMSWMLYRGWRERMLLIARLERNERTFRSLAEMSSDWFWEQDEKFRFIDVSDDIARKFGTSPESFRGKTRWDIGIDKSEEDWIAHRVQLDAHQSLHDFEYCFIDDQGKQRCISVSGEPVFDDEGKFVGYHGVGKDLTEKKQYEERIRQMAQYDSLTGLPNRALFYDRLKQAISTARRESSEFALLYLDLDKFKPVNDRHGHGAGDQLLQMVALRIRGLLRESDTVARLGGDEFAVLLPVIGKHADAEDVAQKIIEAVTAPYALDGIDEEIRIGVSVGIALYPQDSAQSDSLVKAADAAMYKSKPAGNCYCFYDGQTNCAVSPAPDEQAINN